MAPKSLVGKQAPEFTLTNYNDEAYTFTPGASGRPTAIFFYPKTGSYGCTKEACAFRDNLSASEIYKNSSVEVVGISPDPVAKQKEFVEQNKIPYPLLSDDSGVARKAYGVSRGLLGLTESGRVTFVIDSSGTVKDVLDTTLNFSAHAKFVTKWLESLATPTAEARAPEPAAPAAPAVATAEATTAATVTA